MSTHSSAKGAISSERGGTFSANLFSGQTVFITGGTSGIGAATAEYFHSLGATVMAAGLAALDAPIVPSERLTILELDVTDEAALAATLTALPRLDHLVLCAGISRGSEELRTDVFRGILEVNLISAMQAAMAALPNLARQGGTITTIASMYAYFGGAARPAYSASKGGLVQLTKSLAQLLAPDGVRVNAVAPGWIDTPLAKGLSKRDKTEIIKRIPVARWGQASEIADAIAFLASPAAAYITGAVLPVDGGYLIA